MVRVARLDSNFDRKITDSLFWSLLQSWGGRVITFVLFLVLARLLKPVDFGVFSTVVAVLGVLEIFVEQGLIDAIIQRARVTEQLLNAAFVMNLLLSVVFVSALWVISPIISRVMHINELVWILRIASASIIINAFGFCQVAMCRRNFQYRWLAARYLIATAISGIAGIVFALRGYGAWSLVFQTMVAACLNLLLVWVKPQWRPSRGLDFTGVLHMMRYSSHIFGMRVLDFGNTRFVELFLAVSLGAGRLGIYAVGVKIYQILMQLLSSAILDVAHSGFSRLADDRTRFIQAYYRAITFSATIAVPCFALAAVLSREICVSFFGVRWAESASVMLPMMALGAIQVIQFYNGTSFNALGRPEITLRLNVVKIAFTAGSLYLTIDNSVGHIAAVLVFGQLAITPLNFIVAQKVIGISLREVLKRVLPIFLASLGMIGCVCLMREFSFIRNLTGLVQLAVLTVVGVMFYSFVFLRYLRTNQGEVGLEIWQK